LGINVPQSLVARGKKVRALALEGDTATERIPQGTETVTGNLLDPASLDEFFDVLTNTEIVVPHIARFVTVAPDWNQKACDVNVTGFVPRGPFSPPGGVFRAGLAPNPEKRVTSPQSRKAKP
jgi:nucleoside-diphosphate-sugar epimerase